MEGPNQPSKIKQPSSSSEPPERSPERPNHRLQSSSVRLLGLRNDAATQITLDQAQHRLIEYLAKHLPEAPTPIAVRGHVSQSASEILSKLGYGATPMPRDVLEGDSKSLVAMVTGALSLFEFSTSGKQSSQAHLDHQSQILESLALYLDPESRLVLLNIHADDESPSSHTFLETTLAETGFSIRKREDLTEQILWSAQILTKDVSGTDSCSPPRDLETPVASPANSMDEALRLLACRKARCHLIVCQPTRFRVRGYLPGDEQQILKLFASSFHQQRSPEHWRWQYLQAPHGGPKVSLVIDTGERSAGQAAGRLVGQYAGYPVRFTRYANGSGQHLEAHQIGDTMTRPDVRHIGRGPTSLLCRAARHFYASYCQNQVAFNYGFNVGNIQRFSMRFLEARRVLPIALWSRGSDTFDAQLSWLDRRLRKIRILPVEQPDSRWDELLTRVGPQYGFLADRTARYLQWRYWDRPEFSYFCLAVYRRDQLCGWSIFRRVDDTLMWGDCLFDQQYLGLLPAMLTQALAAPWAEGVTKIEGWFSESTAWFCQQLVNLGFRRLPEPNDLALMCVPFSKEDPTEAMRQELYYTLGDSDLF